MNTLLVKVCYSSSLYLTQVIILSSTNLGVFLISKKIDKSLCKLLLLIVFINLSISSLFIHVYKEYLTVYLKIGGSLLHKYLQSFLALWF